MIGQAVRFGVVGALATMIHFVTAIGCVRTVAADPQLANSVGFLVAFVFSFFGQWRWTFRSQSTPLLRALPAYFLISLAGFAVNAIAYRMLLTRTALRFDVGLALVLIAVACMTFLLSRHWAFRPFTR